MGALFMVMERRPLAVYGAGLMFACFLAVALLEAGGREGASQVTLEAALEGEDIATDAAVRAMRLPSKHNSKARPCVGCEPGTPSVAPKPLGGLPITGWTDSLDGVMDSKALCKHLKAEVDTYRERFKSNTKRRLQNAYGAARIVAMENALTQGKAKIGKQLKRYDCLRSQRANPVSASEYAVWRTAHGNRMRCGSLLRQRRLLVDHYQARVKRMMLAKNRSVFLRSVDRLYSVTRSLNARMSAQGCPGAPPAVATAQPSQSGPAFRGPAVVPAVHAQRVAPVPSQTSPKGASHPRVNMIRAQIAAASERITKHQQVSQRLQRAGEALQSRVSALRVKMQPILKMLGQTRQRVRVIDAKIAREVSYSMAKAKELRRVSQVTEPPTMLLQQPRHDTKVSNDVSTAEVNHQARIARYRHDVLRQQRRLERLLNEDD